MITICDYLKIKFQNELIIPDYKPPVYNYAYFIIVFEMLNKSLWQLHYLNYIFILIDACIFINLQEIIKVKIIKAAF